MTAEFNRLENFLAIVVSGKSKRRGQVAKVVWFKDNRTNLEFGDGKRATYSRENSLEIYYRYCGCGRECEHSNRGIAAARERYCELNGLTPAEFCQEYGNLFFKFK